MSSNLTKSTITKTLLDKSGASLIWNDALMTWEIISGTWDNPGQQISNLSKSTIVKSMLSKSATI